MSRNTIRLGSLGLLAITVAGADLFTKHLVQTRLAVHEQVPLVGDYMRLTHIYNPGAAFGLSLGAYSRPVFVVLTLAALAFLIVLLARSSASDGIRILSLTAIIGGALGNLLNRIWIERGVVDWIDVGIGATRWPAFNLADAAITVGAISLALSFWGEGRREGRREVES